MDHNDRDSADYSTTFKSNRYYLRIFAWCLDRIVHALYVVVCWLGKDGIGIDGWADYSKDIQDGRKDFQIDLGMSLIKYAIELDWKGERRPDWMRQGEFVPCDCSQCYHYLNRITTGVAHKRPRPVEVVYANNVKRVTKECSEFRVDLDKGSCYCKSCYRFVKVEPKNEGKKTKELQGLCNKSRLGCAQCREHICESCWDSYDHPKCVRAA